MKSGVAIFSTRGDPFPPPGRKRSHYHPSESLPLSPEQRGIVLSPERLHPPPSLSAALSPPESDSSAPFDESWPSSEGSAGTPEQKTRGPGVQGGLDSTDTASEDSVIARYIARFRTGRPTSRLERSPPPPAQKDFWWLQTSPDSPDIQRFRPEPGVSSASLRLSSQSLERSPNIGEASLDDSGLQPEDVEIAGLHHKAGKLLLQSESFLRAEDPVSSDGLGSSSSSSAVSRPASDVSRIRGPTLDSVPAVPVLHAPLVSSAPSVRSHPPPSLPPEEDILYQWRLRRKMEQAREGTLPGTTRHRSSSPPVRIPKQVLSTSDSAPVSRLSSCEAAERLQGPAQVPMPTSCIGHVPIASPMMAPCLQPCAVPPHLHLQCDVLPCVHTQTPSAQCTHPQAKTAGTRLVTAPTAGSALVSRVGRSEEPSERPRTQAEQIPQRRSQRRPEEQKEKPKVRKEKSKEEKSQRRGDQNGKPGRRVEAPPPASPVHRAMEQVISERLFSPPASPELKPEPTRHPAEEERHSQPLEFTNHLLGEVEDSDGEEFADDPLLQVLREQRQSLRSRLWAVELRLSELEDENKGNKS